MATANLTHRLFTGHDLSPQVENELMKLFNNDDIDEKFIIDNMDYLKDIIPTIEALQTEYYNYSSFKTYLNVLVVMTSHLPSLKDNIQTITKINIKMKTN